MLKPKEKISTLLQRDKMSKDDNILLGRISKLEICFQRTSSLLQRTKREWYLADNLTDVLTWLKASENLGYEVEKKKKRKGKRKNRPSQQDMPERMRNTVCI